MFSKKQEKRKIKPENMKKPLSKVAHNRHPTFLCTSPAAQTAQKQKFRTTKRPLMQDWVFRLGFHGQDEPFLDFAHLHSFIANRSQMAFALCCVH